MFAVKNKDAYRFKNVTFHRIALQVGVIFPNLATFEFQKLTRCAKFEQVDSTIIR